MIERAVRRAREQDRVSQTAETSSNAHCNPPVSTTGYDRSSRVNRRVSTEERHKRTQDQEKLAALEKWRTEKAVKAVRKYLGDLRRHYTRELKALNYSDEAGRPPYLKLEIAERLACEFLQDERRPREPLNVLKQPLIFKINFLNLLSELWT